MFQDRVGGFVDDLAMVAGEAVTPSQAKSGQVGWNAGVHPLIGDFRLQARLDADAGRAASYGLVVATDAAREAMLAARPPDLGHVAVVAFRAAGPEAARNTPGNGKWSAFFMPPRRSGPPPCPRRRQAARAGP